MDQKIEVMVVDYSAVARKLMRSILNDSPDIHSVNVKPTPSVALKAMQKNWPSVIVLDLDTPKMDGISFIHQVMSTRPTPILIYSNQKEVGARLALEVTSAGAIGVIAKPNVYGEICEQASSEILDAIKSAARTVQNNPQRTENLKEQPSHQQQHHHHHHQQYNHDFELIAVGSSMGGISAIERLLLPLSTTTKGIVIVQHMPEGYTAAFASRLNSLCKIDVKEAEDYDSIETGQALIANGGKHLELQGKPGHFFVKTKQGALVSRHKPSVDVLFHSVAHCAGKRALGIILTGMGSDGASGMKAMFDVGCHTIAQDQASCAIFGMPNEAIKQGGVSQILALNDIPVVLNNPKNLS